MGQKNQARGQRKSSGKKKKRHSMRGEQEKASENRAKSFLDILEKKRFAETQEEQEDLSSQKGSRGESSQGGGAGGEKAPTTPVSKVSGDHQEGLER